MFAKGGIACRFVSDENVLLIIAQTAFSSYVLVNFVMLVLYKIRLEALYGEAYNVLILGNQAHSHQAWLISYVVEYEAIKRIIRFVWNKKYSIK